MKSYILPIAAMIISVCSFIFAPIWKGYYDKNQEQVKSNFKRFTLIANFVLGLIAGIAGIAYGIYIYPSKLSALYIAAGTIVFCIQLTFPLISKIIERTEATRKKMLLKLLN